ncbi:hypothetical protein H8S95_17115 [Pontibacter sp. KCTC 32443]|uniref:hypothetical protein n=1 Tax=Pontibacter TaxID=323449 RepID=UPI00164E0674|nr:MULTISPECIES: hypothetical protein [Pontibacter]MBC5775798.1 hypothetical protein [Pontibacter sp. KCTC 32443]
MYRFTNYIAILLLLLFTRAMVPDALILELHPHTHTIHADHTDAHKAQIGQKHKHCTVEDIFNVPFQGTITSINVASAVSETAYFNYYHTRWHSTSHTFSYLRGPPIV